VHRLSLNAGDFISGRMPFKNPKFKKKEERMNGLYPR
jgi:hypothetical protein